MNPNELARVDAFVNKSSQLRVAVSEQDRVKKLWRTAMLQHLATVMKGNSSESDDE